MYATRLLNEDTSLTHAMRQGGTEFYGWGYERHILADIHDAIQFQSERIVNWASKKPPELPRWPRPEVEVEKKPQTVADLFARFSASAGAVITE